MPEIPMKTSEKELLRWALADHAFREADALAKHILDSKMEPGTHLFSACVAGVVVSYCRPFMGAEGLGPLPLEMRQFTGEKFEPMLMRTHETLFEARNKLVAHFDRLHGEERFKNGEYHFSPSEVIFDLRSVGTEVTTTGTHLHPVLLEHAHGLFLFQMERVGAKLGGFGAELLLKHQRFGKYTFKVPN